MRSKKVLRYYCDHCNKGFWKKQDCKEHEEICFYNPEVKACATCFHCEPFDENGTRYCYYEDEYLLTKFDVQRGKKIGDDGISAKRGGCLNHIFNSKEGDKG